MGVTFTTVCMRCSVDAPEVGDFGYIGLPSLETKRTKKHTQPFGYLYAGLAALGLLTEEIEAFHAFLQEHRGHPMHQFSDADAEDIEADADEQDDVAPAPTNTRKFVFKKGRFVEAFHEVACEACGEVRRASESASLRPFEGRPLTQEQAKLFRTNCDDLESNTARVGGFPFDDAEAISKFLRQHAGHALLVRLDASDASPRAQALEPKASAATAWTPPEWTPQLHEDRLGRPTSPDARRALVLLRDREPGVREAALGSLREAADPASFGHVVSMWLDPEPSVRAAAVAAIGALDDPRRPRVLGHALLDESEAVRSAAADALRAAGLDRAQAAAEAATPRAADVRPEPKKLPSDLASLRPLLLDPSSSWRGMAAERLAKIRGPDAADVLLEALCDPSVHVRQEAVQGLVRHGRRDPRVVPALLQAVRDYADWVASEAVKALGKLKVKEAVPLIEQRLRTPTWRSRIDDIEALQKIGGPEILTALVAALDHGDELTRGLAADALGRVETGAAEHLVKALDSPAADLREQAVYALVALKHEAAGGAIARGFGRPTSDSHKVAIVTALGELGGPDAPRVLVAALRDRAKQVRAAAAAALVKRNDARGNRVLAMAARNDPAVAEMTRKRKGRK